MNDSKIWTGWCDYYATGEGRTICAMIAMAENETRFRERARETLGGYVFLGFDVAPGVVRNAVTEALWAATALDFIEANQSAGNVVAHASLHFNFA